MKLIKQMTSAMLSMAIIAGTTATGLSARTDTAAAGTKLMYNTVISEWKTRINHEKNKVFPDGSYWNHIGLSSFDDNTCTDKPCRHVHDHAQNIENCCKTQLADGSYMGQCYGFAYKLAKDIWKTEEYYSFSIENNNDYEPRIGDNVRLNYEVEGSTDQGHSIFITDISGDNITFAECNGELQDCRITWDRTSYYERIITKDVWVEEIKAFRGIKAGDPDSVATVTKDFLIKYGTLCFRPVIAGDLNKNGRLDSGDAEIFEQTVMKNGWTSNSNHTPLSYYDVNGDGYVDTKDYNEIRYGSNNYRLILPGESPKCRWDSIMNDHGFLFNGCYYVPNNIGGASWIGVLDTELTSVYVSSRVYNSNDRKWYDVNEIGYDSHLGFGGSRTCTADCKIKTLYIPDSIKRIHSYTFENGQLTSLRFSGSNPQLDTIDEYAFYNCKTLKTLDLIPAKKLKTICSNAFDGCTGLYHIDLPYTTHTLNLGSGNGSIFGSTNPRSATIEITNPNRSTSPSSNFQKISISNQDLNYWKNYKLYFHGRIFKIYNQNRFICQQGEYLGYLSYPQ